MAACEFHYPTHSFAIELLKRDFDPVRDGVTDFRGLKRYIDDKFPAPNTRLRGPCWEVICEWMIQSGLVLPNVIGTSTEAEMVAAGGIRDGFVGDMGGEIHAANVVGIDGIIYRQIQMPDGSKVNVIDVAQFKYTSKGGIDLGRFTPAVSSIAFEADETTKFVFISSSTSDADADKWRTGLADTLCGAMTRRAKTIPALRTTKQREDYVERNSQGRIVFLTGRNLANILTPGSLSGFSSWLSNAYPHHRRAVEDKRIKAECESLLAEPDIAAVSKLKLAGFRAMVDKWCGKDPGVRELLAMVATKGIPVTTFEARIADLEARTGFSLIEEMKVFHRSFGTYDIPMTTDEDTWRYPFHLSDVPLVLSDDYNNLRLRYLSAHWHQMKAAVKNGEIYDSRIVEFVKMAENSDDGVEMKNAISELVMEAGVSRRRAEWISLGEMHWQVIAERIGYDPTTTSAYNLAFPYNEYIECGRHSVSVNTNEAYIKIANSISIDSRMYVMAAFKYDFHSFSKECTLRKGADAGVYDAIGSKINCWPFNAADTPACAHGWRHPKYAKTDEGFERIDQPRLDTVLRATLEGVVADIEIVLQSDGFDLEASERAHLAKVAADLQTALDVGVAKALTVAYHYRDLVEEYVVDGDRLLDELKAIDEMDATQQEELVAQATLRATTRNLGGVQIRWTDTTFSVHMPDGRTLEAEGRVRDGINVAVIEPGEKGKIMFTIKANGTLRMPRGRSEDELQWSAPSTGPGGGTQRRR